MANVWSGYWKFIEPSKKHQLTSLKYNAEDPYNAYGLTFSSASSFSALLKGSGTRLAKYSQFEAMDCDIFVSRALDIIAEEATNKDETTRLPFQIEYQNEDNQDVSPNTITTLRAALRHWCDKHNFETRLFKIARGTFKYGDYFFLKKEENKKWMYIDPQSVMAIEVDEENNIVAYHVQEQSRIEGQDKVTELVTVYPKHVIVHFTMSDDLGDLAPFGESILMNVHQTFRQLSMLENASIIYRLVRAPERRAFFIDTGNMNPRQVRQYMETIKNDMRQKRMPNASSVGDPNGIDSMYNPQSMQEDYFFPVSADSRGSRVETVQGGMNLGENFEIDYFKAKLLEGLRIPSSYMNGPEKQGTQYNDGKIGVAYSEELRFAHFVMRLQPCIERVFDAEFKKYLEFAGINIPSSLFKIRLCVPQNFAKYRQAQLDQDMISTFKQIEDIKYLSKEYMMKRFLGLTEDEIQMNRQMLIRERNIKEDDAISVDQQIYDPAFFDNREPINLTKKKGKKSADDGEENNDDGFGGNGGGMDNQPPPDFGGEPNDSGFGDDGGGFNLP